MPQKGDPTEMGPQGPLFDNLLPKIVRKKDPETSKESAEILVRSGAYARRKALVRGIIRDNPGVIGRRIAELSGIEDRTCTSSIMARLRDDDRVVFNYPEEHPLRKLRDTQTGRLALRWWPVEGNK